MILSSLPIGMFLVIQVITPNFYASVWHEDLTKIGLAARRLLDADRQLHHVPHGQLQDLTHGLDARPSLRTTATAPWSVVLVFLAAVTLPFA